jgi:putative addiction module killer protein
MSQRGFWDEQELLSKLNNKKPILKVLTEKVSWENFFLYFSGLRDRAAKARIDIRIRRLSLGNPGDVRPVREGVSEFRIRYGPGYRIYFISQGNMLIILLAGGDKGSQAKDIQHAKDLARNL